MNHDDLDPALDPALDQYSRRAFIERVGTTTVAAAFLGTEAAAQRPGEALKDQSLVRQEVDFPSGETRVKAFLCRPKTPGRRGSVIVVHEIFGLNDHIKDLACRFARAGCNGLAVNFFTREGNPPDAAGGFGPVMEFVGRIPDAQVLRDVRAAVKFLESRPDSNGKVGLVGYCWGGRVAMLAAAGVPELDAAVAYYGRIRLAAKNERQTHGAIDLVDQVRVPILGHFGAADQGIPVSDVEAYRNALKAAGKTAEIHIYEGAGHAFNNDTRPSFHPESARLAWQRTLAWFAKHLR